MNNIKKLTIIVIVTIAILLFATIYIYPWWNTRCLMVEARSNSTRWLAIKDIIEQVNDSYDYIPMYLSSEYSRDRSNAIIILACAGYPMIIDVCIDKIDDKDYEPRITAYHVLCDLTNNDYELNKNKWREWWKVNRGNFVIRKYELIKTAKPCNISDIPQK